MPWTPVLAGSRSMPRSRKNSRRASIQRVVVPVDVAHVDPGADHVGEAHAGRREELLGDAEHVVRFLERVPSRAVDVPGVEATLVAQADDPWRCTSRRAASHEQPVGRLTSCVDASRDRGTHRDGGELEVGQSVERRLPDDGRRRLRSRHSRAPRDRAARAALPSSRTRRKKTVSLTRASVPRPSAARASRRAS